LFRTGPTYVPYNCALSAQSHQQKKVCRYFAPEAENLTIWTEAEEFTNRYGGNGPWIYLYILSIENYRYSGASLIRRMAEEGNPGGKVPSLMDLHEKCLPVGGKSSILLVTIVTIVNR
jgi:hypothetical protein